MRTIGRALLLSGMLALAFSLAAASGPPMRLDATKPLTQYVLDAWRDDTGLPVDSIAAIAQTPDGYLWIGTEQGLVRFDGIRFTVFDKKSTSAFRVNEVTALLAGRDGTLWIGTRGGGIVTFDGRNFIRTPVALRFIFGLAEAPDGSVWAAAPVALCRVRKHELRYFGKKEGYEGGRVDAIAADAGGAWVSLSNQVLHVGEKGIERFTARDGLSGTTVTALRWTSHGLVAGNDAGGADRLAGNRFEPLLRGSSPHAIVSIVEGAGGSLWMATTGGGVVRWAGGKLDSLGTHDGLTSDSLTQIFEDAEGNLWVGTIGGGLVRLKESKVASLELPDSLGTRWVLPVLHARDGSVWMGTMGGGVTRLKDGVATHFTVANGLRSNTTYSLVEDPDGSIWVASESALHRIHGGRIVQTLTKADGLAGTMIFGLDLARDGSLWVGTNGGLNHITRGKIETLTYEMGYPKGSILSIRSASDGSLWLATPREVDHCVGGRCTAFRRADGLTPGRIANITIDEKDGSVWVATGGDGIARIHDGHVRTYRAQDGLLDDAVYNVVQDRGGDLWIPTSRGLFTVQRAAFDLFDARSISRIPITVFKKSDGLKTSDFSGGFDRPGFRDADGRLWFPTTRGVILVDPEKMPPPLGAPRVRIEGVQADGAAFAPSASGTRIDLPPEKRQLQIEYTAPSFYAPETTTFRFLLAGFDGHWQEAGTRRTAYYNNVPPGRYQFLVEATNGGGGSARTSTVIEVVPRFYEGWPFKLAIALTILLGAVVLHRRRMDALREHASELRRSEEHFRSLIENATDVILVTDANGIVRYASPSFDNVLGSPANDFLGRPAGKLLGREAADAFFDALRARRRTITTFELRDPAGMRRELEVCGVVSEEDSSFILNCRDVTDRRRLEAQLEQANRLASLGRLAATVSHEFNNVLMGIQPFVDILRRRNDSRDVQHATAQMSRSISRGKHISEEILRYTRPAGPTLRPVPVRTWLSDMQTELGALIGANVRLAIVAPPRLTISADLSQLNQVVTNLAINARDAGASSVRIEARPVEGGGVFPFGIIREPQRFAHISVIDNGSGIPDSLLTKIFEPLFTTKVTSGTGLGLAVAQQVIARHGGEIFVESRLGAGTTFHIFIPIAVSEQGELLTAVEPEPPPAAGGRRVLLIEDDPAVGEGVAMLLEAEGFRVELAPTGSDALNVIPRFLPDLMILDVGLPDIDGVELYGIIVAKWPEIPVLFSTGHGDFGLLEETLGASPRGYILKPYTIEALLAAIASVLDREQSVA